VSTKILFFASLKSFLGREQMTVDIPQSVNTVEKLKAWLSETDPALKTAFETMPRLRSAVNQEMAFDSTDVKDGDEIAFFPPVTGG
jgi:molybdopterin synthase sulfur carrier subunit